MNLGLAPIINSIEICRDEQNRPLQLLLRGSNLLPSVASQVIVDGTFSPEFRPGPDAAEALVRIPDPRLFDYNRTHSIIYTTPNGIAIKKF